MMFVLWCQRQSWLQINGNWWCCKCRDSRLVQSMLWRMLQWENGTAWSRSDMEVFLTLLFCCWLLLDGLIDFEVTVTPVLIRLCQVMQAWAASSQVTGLMPQYIRETFRVSLYNFFWPLWECLPAFSSLYNSLFGRHSTECNTCDCPPELRSLEHSINTGGSHLTHTAIQPDSHLTWIFCQNCFFFPFPYII